MFRSLWRLRIETYQGTDVFTQREIDWKASIVIIYEGLVQTHILGSIWPDYLNIDL